MHFPYADYAPVPLSWNGVISPDIFDTVRQLSGQYTVTGTE